MFKSKYGTDTDIGIPIGSLLMLFILRKLSKDKILAVIIRSLLGGFAGFLWVL
jgi:hypothetical protein